jgi:hypothetical protein
MGSNRNRLMARIIFISFGGYMAILGIFKVFFHLTSGFGQTDNLYEIMDSHFLPWHPFIGLSYLFLGLLFPIIKRGKFLIHLLISIFFYIWYSLYFYSFYTIAYWKGYAKITGDPIDVTASYYFLFGTILLLVLPFQIIAGIKLFQAAKSQNYSLRKTK